MRNIYLEAAAETQFFVRPFMLSALEKYELTDEGRAALGGATNYREYWEATFSDRWFDMSTFVRLGTAVEVGLRQYHIEHDGPSSDREIYQRLVQPADLVELYKTDCDYDLQGNAEWQAVREIMVHRHLYAHRSGLIDEQYVINWKKVTGIDLLLELGQYGYPTQEVYWFRPLRDLPRYIEAGRAFFRDLP